VAGGFPAAEDGGLSEFFIKGLSTFHLVGVIGMFNLSSFITKLVI
jgi:hypothetical protein